jgi:hypothetical protein
VVSWTSYDLVKGGCYVFNAVQAEQGRRIRDYGTAKRSSLLLTPQSIVGSVAR